MSRLASLVAVLVVSSAAFVAGQAGPAPQGGLPGLPARPQLPGLPPRDNAAPAPAKDGTSKISGRVLGGPAGTPLRRAQIQLMSSDLTQRRMTTTDGEGRYHFDKLPAGRFSLTATKGGYVSLQYGQRRPYEAGTPVTVSDGQTLEKVDFTLPRGSVIAVRVTDEFGEALTGVTVQVQRYQYGQDGRRKLTAVTGAPSPFSGTDDRGEFRLFGLMPGEYVVQAAMRTLGPPIGATNDTSEGYSPTFYPGVLSADQAQPISVGLGEEQSVQFAMMSGRMGRAAGKVLDLESRPVAGASISLVTITGNGSSTGPAGQTAADGTFTVNGIAPGEHTLQVTLRAPGATPLSGSVPISLGGEDLEGLTVTLGSGATLSGRVVFDGTAPRTASPAALRVSAGSPAEIFAFMTRAYDPLANGEVDDKGTFKLGGVSGRVFIGVNAPLDWTIRSITAGGENITDEPIELTNGRSIEDIRIVLTDKQTQVSGRVTDERGRPQSDYVVVVLPAQKKEPLVTSRLIRVVRPDTQGRYELRGLRPGNYVAASVDLLEDGRQYSPEFQEKLRLRARTFSLEEGQSVTLDLELATGL